MNESNRLVITKNFFNRYRRKRGEEEKEGMRKGGGSIIPEVPHHRDFLVDAAPNICFFFFILSGCLSPPNRVACHTLAISLSSRWRQSSRLLHRGRMGIFVTIILET